MNIDFFDDGAKGKFYIGKLANPDAEITFVYASPKEIIVDHTFVDQNKNEKGTGKLLVAKVVEFAREKQFKIIPLCQFASAVIQKNEAFHDVLKK